MRARLVYTMRQPLLAGSGFAQYQQVIQMAGATGRLVLHRRKSRCFPHQARQAVPRLVLRRIGQQRLHIFDRRGNHGCAANFPVPRIRPDAGDVFIRLSANDPDQFPVEGRNTQKRAGNLRMAIVQNDFVQIQSLLHAVTALDPPNQALAAQAVCVQHLAGWIDLINH